MKISILAGAMVAIGSCAVANADPPFSGTIYLDPDIITDSDPTTFVSLSDDDRGTRWMYDRRVPDWVNLNAYLFMALFDDGLKIEIQVNPEFGDVASARAQAAKYAPVIGRLPSCLRADVQTVWIHLGNEALGGGNNNLLIHTEGADQAEAGGILEESLAHEAAHTSLDAAHAGAPGWLAAQSADGEFISTYARDYPNREDIAESFLVYLALRYRADRISQSLKETISQTIPNRISYFDSQPFDLYPLVPPEPFVFANTGGDYYPPTVKIHEAIAFEGKIGNGRVSIKVPARASVEVEGIEGKLLLLRRGDAKAKVPAAKTDYPEQVTQIEREKQDKQSQKLSSDGKINHTVVKDIFGRSLNDQFIGLVDWQGHVANPAIELRLTPPRDAEFPYRITILAEGSSRLMLDLPSDNNSNGASKQIEFSGPDSILTIHLTIAPDRVGDQYEVENYKLSILGPSESTNEIPINVLDQDDSLEPSIKTHFDYEHDNIAKLFDREGFREAAEMAIKDWVYFFDYESFDPVAIGEESISLPGNDWKNHIQVKNQVRYEGFYVFMRSIDSPHSTGFPASNGNYHKRRRFIVPGPIHRSYALILHLYPNAKPFASTSCEDWHLTDPYAVSDIYGLSMHEIGHAFAFHSSWPKHEEYKKSYDKATKVIEYQGYPVPLDPSGHIPGDKMYLDRISGQSGGWSGLFPPRRWLLTKLALLIASESGLKLRPIGPFLSPEIMTQELPPAKSGMTYSTKLKSNFGGVPFYEWTVIDGVLPEGLNLDGFTGRISGTVKARPGEYPLEIQLRDYDPLRRPVSKNWKMIVQ